MEKIMAYQKSISMSFCTTRQAAILLNVSLRTAQLWVEKGLLEAWKTTGGHRRISRASINRRLVGSSMLNSVAEAPPP
jgi:excisionase family DNA binding protein